MKVRYSPRAIADLNNTSDYLKTKSVSGAVAVEAAIMTCIKLIGEYPRSGRVIEQRPNVRVMPLSRYPYLVFYTIAENGIVVLHIRHGARRPIDPMDL